MKFPEGYVLNSVHSYEALIAGGWTNEALIKEGHLKPKQFEIVKGDEKHFKGAPDWANFVTESRSGYRFFSDEVKSGAKTESEQSGQIGKMQFPKYHSIIAERRPIAEPQPDADGWIEWNGGECPVKHSEFVDIKLWDGSVFMQFDSGACNWKHASLSDDVIAYRLSQPPRAEPVKPEGFTLAESSPWDGHGLPPVGTVCEWQSGCAGGFITVEILAIHGEEVWCKNQDEGDTFVVSDNDFRPIPTAEQVREKAIQGMADILRRLPDCYQEYDAAEAIYDAGYRKNAD